MRTIPESFAPAVVAEIDRRLDEIESSQGVAIPWGIESGSRAWGFPSPDSDYDCRFFYVRAESAYLSPWRERDVIETPLDEIFDVNGWDLIKAVQLLVKGNAVAIEWLRSPHIYRGDSSFRDGLVDLATEIVDRNAVGRHYLHVGATQWGRYGGDAEVPLKRLFYALRPAASVRWLMIHRTSAVPPMELMPLLIESDAPADVIASTQELIALKSQTKEMGTGQTPAPILRYIDQALTSAEAEFEDRCERSTATVQERGRDYFIDAVQRHGPGGRPH